MEKSKDSIGGVGIVMFDLNDLKHDLESITDDFVTFAFGEQALVIISTGVRYVIPEVMA